MGSTIVKTGKDPGAMKDLKYTDKFLLTMREAHTKKHYAARDVANVWLRS